MKVLVYDSDFASSGNIYPIKLALEELGHEAVMFDWRKYQYTYSESSIFNRFLDRVLINNVVRKINEDLRKKIASTNFDILLVLRGEHITADTIEFAIQNVTNVVNWNTDDLFNPLNSSNNVLEAFSKYHIHFTPRTQLKNEYIEKGARNVKRVDWYYRPELAINNFPESISFDCDIRFNE